MTMTLSIPLELRTKAYKELGPNSGIQKGVSGYYVFNAQTGDFSFREASPGAITNSEFSQTASTATTTTSGNASIIIRPSSAPAK